MKRNDWIFAATVLIFSLLFYRQTSGLNFLLFNIILIAGSALLHPGVMRKRNWLLAAAAALGSAFAVFYYGNALAITANTIAVFLFAGISNYAGGSVIISLVITFVSVCISFVSMIIDSITRLENRGKAEEKSKIHWKKTVIVLMALVVVLIFFFMYRSSNVLFYEFTKDLSLDFISIPWILFTGAGVLFVYGLYSQRIMRDVAAWDSGHRLTLVPADPEKKSWTDKLMSLSSERFAALILFALLNLLLLLVNSVDFIFLAGNKPLPEGVTYTKYLHQGVGMLITSIVAAMLIILYFFRGRLNFESNSRTVRNMALLWIVQNALMLISTAYRNAGYIHEYGLTYKRIGVFIYLLLVLIGLATVTVKLYRRKTNAYLFRSNGWLYVGVLVCCSFVNWDRLIVRYNLMEAKQPDYTYLTGLSYNTYPELAEMYRKGLLQGVPVYNDERGYMDDTRLYFASNYYQFLNRQENISWQSYCLHKQTVSRDMKTASLGKNTALNLSEVLDKPFVYYPAFDGLTELDLAHNALVSIDALKNYRHLKILRLRDNQIQSLDALSNLTELEELDIRENPSKDLRPLYGLKKLRRLELSLYNFAADEIRKLQQALPELVISN